MKHTIIIAEAGVNHNGDLNRAFELIDIAADAGVDYVKFQTFNAANLVSDSAKKADYQVENTRNSNESQLQMLQNLELSFSDHEAIINHCRFRSVKFFSTAFDLESLSYLSTLDLDMVKIPSGEITNLPYLRQAAESFSKVILSTGMASLDEIGEALKVFFNEGMSNEDITILHCNTEYPTPMSDVNLKAMLTIGEKFGTAIGYSDHTLGIEVPVAAVALGATVIEKHFTIDRTLPGPDHAASLEPGELKAMVKAVRNIELAISGSGVKAPSSSESKNINIARKSVHLKVDKSKGEILTVDDLVMLRPGDGISPMRFDYLIGKTVNKDLKSGYKLSLLDLDL